MSAATTFPLDFTYATTCAPLFWAAGIPPPPPPSPPPPPLPPPPAAAAAAAAAAADEEEEEKEEEKDQEKTRITCPSLSERRHVTLMATI